MLFCPLTVSFLGPIISAVTSTVTVAGTVFEAGLGNDSALYTFAGGEHGGHRVHGTRWYGNETAGRGRKSLI